MINRLKSAACKKCAYYGDLPPFIGTCRVNPPVVLLMRNEYPITEFPRVAPDEWCGAFQPMDVV